VLEAGGAVWSFCARELGAQIEWAEHLGEFFFFQCSLQEWPQTDDENGEDETFPSYGSISGDEEGMVLDRRLLQYGLFNKLIHDMSNCTNYYIRSSKT
jgi:hypothetical protein